MLLAIEFPGGISLCTTIFLWFFFFRHCKKFFIPSQTPYAHLFIFLSRMEILRYQKIEYTRKYTRIVKIYDDKSMQQHLEVCYQLLNECLEQNFLFLSFLIEKKNSSLRRWSNNTGYWEWNYDRDIWEFIFVVKLIQNLLRDSEVKKFRGKFKSCIFDPSS